MNLRKIDVINELEEYKCASSSYFAPSTINRKMYSSWRDMLTDYYDIIQEDMTASLRKGIVIKYEKKKAAESENDSLAELPVISVSSMKGQRTSHHSKKSTMNSKKTNRSNLSTNSSRR